MTPSSDRPSVVAALDPADAPRLRETLLAAGFTVAGTHDLLGPVTLLSNCEVDRIFNL